MLDTTALREWLAFVEGRNVRACGLGNEIRAEGIGLICCVHRHRSPTFDFLIAWLSGPLQEQRAAAEDSLEEEHKVHHVKGRQGTTNITKISTGFPFILFP